MASGEQGEGNKPSLFRSQSSVMVHALRLAPPDSHPPCLLSQLDHPVFHVTAPGFWDHGPIEEHTEAGQGEGGTSSRSVTMFGDQWDGIWTSPGPRDATAFPLSPKYVRCCLPCPTCDFLHSRLVSQGSLRPPPLTHTVVADTAVRGPGRPKHLTGEAVLELHRLSVNHHLPSPRGRSVCGAACVI